MLHFLVIGAVLFALDEARTDRARAPAADEIVVTAETVERLSRQHETRFRRPPSPEEVERLIAYHVREEAFVREATALGLDRDDEMIRRRLAQKFEFLMADVAAMRTPTEDEIADWFAANGERYRTPDRFAFEHVFFNLDLRGAAGAEAAGLTLAALRTDAPADPESIGDRHMIGGPQITATRNELDAMFGPGFAEALAGLEPGEWAGPVRSGYGLHLVRLDAFERGALPPYAEVRPRVRDDWAYEQRRLSEVEFAALVVARYRVVIERPEGEARP